MTLDILRKGLKHLQNKVKVKRNHILLTRNPSAHPKNTIDDRKLEGLLGTLGHQICSERPRGMRETYH
jgi:hypothetical protein